MLQRLQRLITSKMGPEIKKVPIPRRGVDYRGKVVLAPMVRSGELPSRLLALHYGADLVWTPETVDKAVIGTTRRENPIARTINWVKPNNGQKNTTAETKETGILSVLPEKEAGKVIFQIGTSDPELAVQAARLVAADVNGIDVNAGCPKPFSTHSGMGAALLQTPDKLCAILEALVKNIVPEFEIGISVKIRILDTPEKTEALVRKLVATGITGLTVHCRTTPMRPRERAIRGQLRMIADICRENGVACLMNGDVESRDQALQLVEEFGVDGAMIATAAEKNSSCFRTAADGGLSDWKEVVGTYLKYSIDVRNRYGNTKYLLCQIVPGKSPLYKRMSEWKSFTQLCRGFGFEELVPQAQLADEFWEIDPEGGRLSKRQAKAAKKSSAIAAGSQGANDRAEKPKKKLSERGVTAAHVQPEAQAPQESVAAAVASAPAPSPQPSAVST